MTQTIRAAVVQATSVGFDTAASLDKLDALAANAAAQGAQIALFPEAFLGSYPRGVDFGVTVGNRTDAGRDLFVRYHAAAVDVPGPAINRLVDCAKRHGLHLVVGVIEREGGTLYCTVVTVGPDGLIGRRRKLMPTAAERYLWGQGRSAVDAVWETPLGRVGTAICWENYMPLLRAHLYAGGTEIYCAPTADARELWQSTIRHIAREGGCFVLSANQFVPDTCPGGSAILSPMGEFLAGPLVDSEGILIADLDPTEIVRAKFDLDTTGHYARPDLFDLTVR